MRESFYFILLYSNSLLFEEIQCLTSRKCNIAQGHYRHTNFHNPYIVYKTPEQKHNLNAIAFMALKVGQCACMLASPCRTTLDMGLRTLRDRNQRAQPDQPGPSCQTANHAIMSDGKSVVICHHEARGMADLESEGEILVCPS